MVGNPRGTLPEARLGLRFSASSINTFYTAENAGFCNYPLVEPEDRSEDETF
jgi:hypothetical protein